MNSNKKFDNPSPRLRANPFSKLIFWWLKAFFWYGRDHDLEVKDLHNALPKDLSEPLGNRLERNWITEIQKAQEAGRKPKLITAIKRTFLWSYMYYGGWMLFLNAVLKVLQPFTLGLLIWHFDVRAKSTPREAYMYASGVVLMTILIAIINHHANLGQLEIGMRVRISCSCLIYRKILRLSRSAVGKVASGQIMNLLSNDVARFDQVFVLLHYVWIMPIQGALITYLIWGSVGISSLAGVFLITIQTIPVQGYIGKWTSKLRLKTALRTDERVRLMSEIISGIRVIKMYTWEKPFEKLVALARSYEIDVLTLTSYLRGFNVATFVFTERTTLYFTIMAYVLLGETISADKVFSMAQYFNILQATMAIYFPLAVSCGAEALVSIKRIENFLLLDENVPTTSPPLTNEDNGVVIKNVTASWTENSIVNTLHKINIHIERGKLCILVGPIGAGKSSLLQLIIGELRASHGQVHVSGNVSFASQEPWLFAGTVRNNILFGQPYDKEKYHKVAKVCALLKDFEQFPQGDKTFVGDRGSALSGGQRARINLARAVYRDADVYLLDDPLSAVDPHVGKHLFKECINDYLSNKTRILVTHQIQHLKNADLIVVLNNGQVEKQGTFEEFQKKQVNFLHLLSVADTEEKFQAGEPAVHHPNVLSEVPYVSSSVDEEEDDEPQETEELMATGNMSKSLYWKYFRTGGSPFMLFVLVCCLIVGQFSSSGTDYWVAFWTKQEELRLMHKIEEHALNGTTINFTTTLPSILSRDNFSDDKFKNVVAHITSTNSPILSILTNKSFTEATVDATELSSIAEQQDQVTSVLPIDLSNVTDTLPESLPTPVQHSNNSMESMNVEIATPYYFDTYTALWIYGILVAGSVILTTARNLLFYKICMNSGRGLHNVMFSCLLKAPMQFFDMHPSGRILNRFSKDIGAVDEILPKTMIDSIQVFAVTSGILTQILIINWWMIFPMLVVAFCYWKIRNLFLASAQDVKRLEGITKSPVFSHVNSSLSGLATIRSSDAQEIVRKEFDAHQDVHTSAYSLIITTGTAFGFWLDIVSTVFVAFVTYSFIVLDDGNTFGGNVGLAISQVLILCGMLQYGMRQTAEMITQMTCVERIFQFTQLEKEGPFESDPGQKPSSSWPAKGQIKFDHVYLHYSNTDAPILNDLNFVIKQGTKVGIVGRTGAGKTSLISALFHLAKLDGAIYIDEVNIKKIGLYDLRNKVSIIPQEPMLFSASLRDNLDPFHKFDDAALWLVIEEVELKDAVTSLDHVVNQGGSNFSAGQRQLLCLARAILRNNKILVLDEATANVDPTTDSLIQIAIKKKFKDCTVLTIAHRLNTIMDSDKVLVMNRGRAIEFDHPHTLLQNENGYFTKMVRDTGNIMAEKLRNIAKEAYERIPKESVPIQITSNGSIKS